MSGTDILDTGTPTAPSGHRRAGHRRSSQRGFLKRLSDRTPLRIKLITALLALVIVAIAAISVASVYMLRGYVTTERDTTLTQDFPRVLTNNMQPGNATPAIGGGGLIIGVQQPGSQLTW